MFEGPLLDDMDERNNPSWLRSPIWDATIEITILIFILAYLIVCGLAQGSHISIQLAVEYNTEEFTAILLECIEIL